MILRTERLILRPLKGSDAQSITDNINNINVSKWLLVVPHPYSIKDARTWIKGNQKKWSKRPLEDYSFGKKNEAEKQADSAR